VTFQVRVNDIWTDIYQDRATGNTTYIMALADKTDDFTGWVSGIRFLSPPDQQPTFHNFDPSLRFTFNDGNPAPTPTPEPGTWLMLGTGLLGLVGYGWRRKYLLTA
jgi:hypothetical protein